jgi:O-antigen/teichoic acid export membrane protein
MSVAPATRESSVLSAALWFAIPYAGALITLVVVNALASRQLRTDYGYFALALSVCIDLGLLGLWGAHRNGLREAARVRDAHDARLADLRHSVRAVSTLLLPAVAGLSAVGTLVVASDHEKNWLIAVAVGFLVWWTGQQKLVSHHLRGFGRVRLAGLLEGRSGGLLVGLAQCLALGVLLWLSPDAGLAECLLAVTAGFALPVLVAWRVAGSRWRHTPSRRPRIQDAREVVSGNRHFSSALVAASINTNLELWLAAIFLTGAQTSLLGAADRISTLVPVAMLSLGVVCAPLVSRAAHRGSAEIEGVLRAGATVATLLTSVLLVPLLIQPGAVLGLVFGESFRPAAVALVVLTLGGVANVVTGLCSVVLSMSGHEMDVARTQWTVAAFRCVLGAALLSYGVTGLAVSSALSTTALWVALWWLAIRRTGIRTHPTTRPDLRSLARTVA